MAKPETKPTRKSIKFSDKFGLDKDRKKLEAGLKNFEITKIVITDSKKRYDHVDRETDEITRGKIPIAQFDCILESGETGKFYSPNSAIVEACENILNDADFAVDKATGILSVPALINEVISGKGEKGRNYIAFA